jgi:hypothetical protein
MSDVSMNGACISVRGRRIKLWRSGPQLNSGVPASMSRPPTRRTLINRRWKAIPTVDTALKFPGECGEHKNPAPRRIARRCPAVRPDSFELQRPSAPASPTSSHEKYRIARAA